MGSPSSSVTSDSDLVPQLKSLLLDLNDHPYPHVPNPPECTKRASVSLVIRVRPTFPDEPAYSGDHAQPEMPAKDRLCCFFDLPWVQRGDPEVLFIKRAARKGDRWTSHVALPGGKREPGDETDRSTALRETMEEIGLDLAPGHALFVGNLPERVVTTSWGTVPLMVLCPFVYLLLRHDVPPLRLQPTEVGSGHWVSMRALLAPSLRTRERADVADRLARRRPEFLRAFFRVMLGQMMFAAVRLVPTESLYCSSIPGFIPDEKAVSLKDLVAVAGLLPRRWNHARSTGAENPLLLWGLTYGIIADLLDLLPTHNTFTLWTWPTFSPWDLQFMVWLFTYRLHQRKMQEWNSKVTDMPAVIEEGLDTLGTVSSQEMQWQPHGVHMDGLGLMGWLTGYQPSQGRRLRSGAIGHLLEGHYILLRRAVVFTLLMRFGVVATLVIFIVRRTRRKQ
ncbi:hypothetical protein MMC13_008356 [Lambiella insularis]|nr:hypothetical protein [Lambiella insularis]